MTSSPEPPSRARLRGRIQRLPRSGWACGALALDRPVPARPDARAGKSRSDQANANDAALYLVRPPGGRAPGAPGLHPAGRSAGGRQLSSAAAVRQMTTDQLTPSQRDASRLFLEGQGWGFGGSVDVEAIEPLDRTRTLRLGRRHRNCSAHHSVHRRGHHLAQPAGTGRTDPARPDAGLLLAARGQRLKPGMGAAEVWQGSAQGLTDRRASRTRCPGGIGRGEPVTV